LMGHPPPSQTLNCFASHSAFRLLFNQKSKIPPPLPLSGSQLSTLNSQLHINSQLF
jgi:hypothetical protein